MAKPIVFMFSGQGSQYFQMGKDLFDQNQVFRKWMIKLNDIAKTIIGESIIDQLYDEKKCRDEKFEKTLYTHPSIFMVEYALAQVLLENGIRPNYVLGASLGEFTGAAVAGIMSVEELLEILIKQAVLFENYCERGSMLAVLHNSNLYYDVPLLFKNSELASINYNSHFVISGKNEHLIDIKEFLKERGIVSEKLSVSHAFHSSLIEPAKSYYWEFLKNKLYGKPKVHFISCLYNKSLVKLPNNYFWDVVREPIQFEKTINELEKTQSYIYLDLGASGTLASFVKRNISKNSYSESYPIITPYKQDVKNLERVKDLFSNKNLFPTRKEEGKMTTYVFPGQGSQYKGMGGTLFDEFAELTAKSDEILGYSIKELCLNDPYQQLGQTQFTQPALYVVSALSYLKKIKGIGKKPDYVAGHSLGEYNALFAAGVFDFETGLKLVKKRGELMSQATGGGMAAVLGLTKDQVNRILTKNDLSGIDVANHNSPSQIVISGLKADIEFAQPIFEAKGAMLYMPLNVSGAFHSRYMMDAKGEFSDFLEELELGDIEIPIISNVYARPYKQNEIKRNLILQITSQVNWNDSIRYLMGLGETSIEEIGPGNVLEKLVNNIQQVAEPLVYESEKEKRVEEPQYQTIKTIKKDDEQLITKNVLTDGREDIKHREGKMIFPIVTALSLGNKQFKEDYNLKYAYVTGAMYRGVASEKMIVNIGKAGMLGFYGTGGMSLERIEKAILYIQKQLVNGESYGMNLLHNPGNPSLEENTVNLFLKHGVTNVEASAYMSINPALVRYRAKGLRWGANGVKIITNRIIAKISRPEVAEAFLKPAPEHIVEKLVQTNQITQEEADLLKEVPMADDLTVEADSGGHTDHGIAYALMPAIIKLRDEMIKKYGYAKSIRIGAAGGIGTPEAAVAAFMLGADFLVTGSINQCTVEAETSDTVKDLLQQANVQDTEYAPAGDMFEIGAKVQVLKKGLFFPARANKLYDLYRSYNSLEEIGEKNRKMIQEKYFKRSFEEIYQDLKAYYPPQVIEKAEQNSKHKMALIFKWYFNYSNHLALSGNEDSKVDYQIHCGPALGAFNQWVKGTKLENWRNRHVNEIGEKLMEETAELMNQRFLSFRG
ncbi:PfaD family protein [Bacillus cereus BAG5X1-1]|uniref:[acyl-carrier-protein] S-malonyltransferase n=1 Tax=Bacillus cereus BAG5X1-1 TaxID=1053189 RepID=J8AI17_BACCE|nr:ACP S-malonyltransferase [Bacillus cereus]EJQ38289.1 PfaD family protein [Bacillus cereus BAG5X1-1]